MRSGYEGQRRELNRRLTAFEANSGQLPPLQNEAYRANLIEQLIDSVQRETYFDQLASRDFSELVADPRSDHFDPLKASVYHRRSANIEEAIWMTFLFVHFGKKPVHGWSYPRAVYGRLASEPDDWWTWEATYNDPTSFRYWLQSAQDTIEAMPGGFGNHRKYQSLDAFSPVGTGAAVESYVEMIAIDGSQQAFLEAHRGETPKESFDNIYRAMKTVVSFGRTACFDYVTALRRLRLADLEAPHTYMSGATGPLKGARYLFTGSIDGALAAGEAQHGFIKLGKALAVGPEVIEDAVCNWQKDPEVYRRFVL